MYYSSVPLGLIIIGGAVNDFTKSKVFLQKGLMLMHGIVLLDAMMD